MARYGDEVNAMIEAAFELSWHLAHGEGISQEEAGQLLAGCMGCVGNWDALTREQRRQYRDRAERLLQIGSRRIPICRPADVWETVSIAEIE